MNHIGVETFDYDLFKTEYDNDPILQALVKDFNNERIILNTKKDKEVETRSKSDTGLDSVHSSAIRSTRKHIKK